MYSNFAGKNPEFWIGQVTDPELGKWGKALEIDFNEGEIDIYSHRCRVRICGYHDIDDLKDYELPLAHIALAPNVSTVGGSGETVQYQGGEVVLGTWLDDDKQQPVITSTLYMPEWLNKYETSESDLRSNNSATRFSTFKGFTANPGKDKLIASADLSGLGVGTGEGDRTTKNNFNAELTVASALNDAKTSSETVAHEIKCAENEIGKITYKMQEFTQFLRKAKALNEADTYLDPIYGGLIDVQTEIKQTASEIHGTMTGLIRRGRSWLIQESVGKLNKTLRDRVDKFNQFTTGQATKNLEDLIFCNINKISDELLDYLEGSLENMLGSVIDVPVCAIENFLGDMFGQVLNVLDNDLGGLFRQLDSLQGGGIALPSEIFSKAIRFSNILTSVLGCDGVTCPEPTRFNYKYGVQKEIRDSFDNIIGKASLNKLINPLLEDINNAIPAVPSRPDCSTNVLRCGPPTVDFIGGGGQGVTGSAIVNALGNIIGVAIGGPGSGFTSPPQLTFTDSCGNGSAAGGFTRINEDGQVTDVVITNSGSGFLPNTTETTLNEDGTLTQTEVIPNPNENYDGEVSYVTTLDDVFVQTAGLGYNDNDTVTVVGNIGSDTDINIVTGVSDDETVTGDATGTVVETGTTGTVSGTGSAEVQLNVQNGSIIGASVVNGGFGFTNLPDLRINTDTGYGAVLLPVLKFTKVEDAQSLTEITQKSVVTVISCIQK